MNESVFGGMTLKELALRTWREVNEDNVLGGAAELAYYFLLALFPMLIFLTSLVGFIPGLQDQIFNGLAKVMPHDAMKIVSDTLRDVVSHRSGGLLSFGLLGALWASSSGVASLMGTLNTAYDVKETRSFFRQRLTAVGLTIVLALIAVAGTALIMFGDKLSAWLTDSLGLGKEFAIIWGAADYILALGILFLALELIYYYAPNLRQDWRWITPGAVFAVGVFIAGSLLFSLYLRYAPDYSATYGSLGAVVVLMLWLYLTGFILLTGAEINSEIKHAAAQPAARKAEGISGRGEPGYV
ncbi:MAG TPA: YihY/virulence factor BrkB family protein [Blastocatellia bacterium]|nr:YihY/virulence factor BrkB family protein [Blastocatellia bacterium]